jgi:hypothetical protein
VTTRLGDGGVAKVEQRESNTLVFACSYENKNLLICSGGAKIARAIFKSELFQIDGRLIAESKTQHIQ